MSLEKHFFGCKITRNRPKTQKLLTKNDLTFGEFEKIP